MALLLYTHSFLTSLVFTCTVETAVLLVFVRYILEKDIRTKDILFAGVFASFATITYVWFVFPVMVPKAVMPSIALSEPFALIVEALFYRMYLRLSWKEALVISFVANMISFFGGRVARLFGVWPVW